jgi:hypothetical protein
MKEARVLPELSMAIPAIQLAYAFEARWYRPQPSRAAPDRAPAPASSTRRESPRQRRQHTRESSPRSATLADMRKLDQKRFARLVSDFIEGSGIKPPLYLIAISNRNGSVAVSRTYTGSDFEQVCGKSVGPGIASPITLVVVAENGSGARSTRIEIEAARGRMQ